MPDKPKIFGELGLGLTRLSKDVKTAKEQLLSLAQQARSLGLVFKEFGVKTNLGNIDKELKNMAKNLTSVTKDTESKTKKMNDNIKQQQSKLINQLSHNVKIGTMSIEEAVKKAQQALVKAGYYTQDSSGNITAKENAKYTQQRVALERFIEDMRRQLERSEQSNLRRQQQADNRELTNLKNKLKAELAEERTKYRQGLINYEQYVNRIRDIENRARSSGAFSERDLSVFSTTQQSLAAQREAARQSSEISRNLIQQRQAGYQQDLRAYLNMLNQELQRDRLTVADRMRLEREAYRVRVQLQRQSVAEARRATSELTSIQNGYFSTSQRRFSSLTDYMVNSFLLYRGIGGIREMAEIVKSIEKESVNLQRVMQGSTDVDMAKYREEAFGVSNATAQTVENVQKIQNLWARVSDEVANNSSLMNELSRVTAVGMNVGGFTDAEEAVQYLAAAVNQMGLQWTDAKLVMDSWIKTADTTAVKSAKDLADVVMRVGSQAKLLGMNYNELNAITGVLANNMAKNGEEIGTAMKTVFSYFQDESAIKTLDKYGVQVKKNAKEYNNFMLIMEQLMNKYNELSADNNQQAIHEINNALGRIRRVDYVGNLIGNWGEIRKVLNDSLGSAGYAMEQNEKVMSTFDAKVSQLKTSFQQLSWSVGESGLLDDLKILVDALASGVQWFNELDPGVKRAMLSIVELAGAFMLLTRVSSLFTGVGIIKLIANTTAEIALATKQQWLFNVAVQAGADIQAAEAGATSANAAATMGQTAALNANTAAQEANNVSEAQGTITSSESAAAEGVETAAVAANTAALGENAAAQLTVNNATLAGRGAAGLFAGAMSALLNPITIVIGAVAALGIGIISYRKHQEAARKEAEKFAQAQKELNKELNSYVISEAEISQYEDKVGKLIGLQQGLEQAENKYNETKKSIGNNKFDLGKSISDFFSGEKSPVFQIEEIEKKLKELGSSSKTVGQDIATFNDIIARSRNEETRTAYQVVKSIQWYQQYNETIKQAIVNYNELSKKTNRTTQETQALQNAETTLIAGFPNADRGIDQLTKRRVIDTNSILKQISAMNGLSEQQATEISMNTRLTEAQKTNAIAYVKAQIEMTKTQSINSFARITNMKKELDTMMAMNKAIAPFQGVFNIQDQEAFKKITPDKIKELIAKNQLPMNLWKADSKDIFSYLQGQGKLHLIDSNYATEYENIIKEKEESDKKVKDFENAIDIIKKIKPFDPNLDTELAGDGDGGNSVDQFYDDIDLKKEKLEQLNSMITVLRSNVELFGDEESKQVEKTKGILKIYDLQTQKVSELQRLNKEYSGTLSIVNKDLSKYITGWSTMSTDQRMEALANASDKTRKKINDLVKSYQNLNEEMRENNQEIATTINEQQQLHNQIEDILEAQVKQIWTTQKELNEKRLLAKQDKEILDLENKIFGSSKTDYEHTIESAVENKQKEIDSLEENIKLLDKQKKYYDDELKYINIQKEALNAKVKALDAEVKAREKLKKLQELQELNKNISEAKEDTRFAYIDENTGKEVYTYDKNKVIDLEKQKTDLYLQISDDAKREAIETEQEQLEAWENSINNRINDIETEKQLFADKQNIIKDEIEAIQKASEEKKKIYDIQLSDLQKFQEQEKQSFHSYWNQHLSDEEIKQRSLQLIKDKGYIGAIQHGQYWLSEYEKMNKSHTNNMYDIGLQLNQALQGGMSKDLDAYIQAKSNEVYQLGQQLRNTFNAGLNGQSMPTNSVVTAKPTGTSSSNIGSFAGSIFSNMINSALNFLPKFHTGGAVGNNISPKQEVIAKLAKGEFVLNEQGMNNVMLSLPRFNINTPKYESTQATLENGKQVTIYINTIKANDFNEMMESIEPHIRSHE